MDFSFLKAGIPGLSKPAEASDQNPSGSQINVHDTASAQIISERVEQRKRGRPTGSGTKTDESGRRKLSAQEEEQLKTLFAPDMWRGLVRAPADAAQALTGSRVFELSKPEIDTLAAGAATTASYFAKTDPKWIALALFSTSMLTIYGSRIVAYKVEKAQKKTLPAVSTIVEQ